MHKPRAPRIQPGPHCRPPAIYKPGNSQGIGRYYGILALRYRSNPLSPPKSGACPRLAGSGSGSNGAGPLASRPANQERRCLNCLHGSERSSASDCPAGDSQSSWRAASPPDTSATHSRRCCGAWAHGRCGAGLASHPIVGDSDHSSDDQQEQERRRQARSQRQERHHEHTLHQIAFCHQAKARSGNGLEPRYAVNRAAMLGELDGSILGSDRQAEQVAETGAR